MKIDRLIGIIIILLQKDKVTAQDLAARFEVSRRTISSDIEDICKAGIPIVTTQGNSGGIAIMENYKIDKTMFLESEIQDIYAGLSALDSVSDSNRYKKVIDKFLALHNNYLQKNSMLIDLSSFYKDNLVPKIHLLEESIETHTKVQFLYHKKNGSKSVTVNPYLVLFQWSSWYVLAYEESSDTFKLYKLLRMTELVSTNESFEVIDIPEETLDFPAFFTPDIPVVILFDACEEYRLLEDYGAYSFTKQEDGRLRFETTFTNQDYLLSWVLSFGSHAELIEPASLRPLLLEQFKLCYETYLN